jgi:hypothetical protein
MGGVNAPAATRFADVIFPAGSASEATLSQEAATTGVTKMRMLTAAINMSRTKLFHIFISC